MAPDRPKHAGWVCYYTERDIFIERKKKRKHRSFARRGARDLCYDCAQRVSPQRFSNLREAKRCGTHYYCAEANDSKCGD